MLTAASDTVGGAPVVRRPRLPWALTTSAALFAVVLGARWTMGGPADATALLFSVPIAMLAIAHGIRAGLAASTFAVTLIVVWTARSDVELSPLGWAARVIPLLLIGVLLGGVVDRFRQAETERRRLEAAARNHREAVEINDTIVQGLTAAKWSLEAGDAGRALDLMTETLDLGHRLVSDLIRQSQISESWTGSQQGSQQGNQPGDDRP